MTTGSIQVMLKHDLRRQRRLGPENGCRPELGPGRAGLRRLRCRASTSSRRRLGLAGRNIPGAPPLPHIDLLQHTLCYNSIFNVYYIYMYGTMYYIYIYSVYYVEHVMCMFGTTHSIYIIGIKHHPHPHHWEIGSLGLLLAISGLFQPRLGTFGPLLPFRPLFGCCSPLLGILRGRRGAMAATSKSKRPQMGKSSYTQTWRATRWGRWKGGRRWKGEPN